MALAVSGHRFTVADYDKMGEAGILDEDARVELIDGEIVDMAPIGPRHSASGARLIRLFAAVLPPDVIIWAQNPIQIGEHWEPQPDFVLLRPRPDFYAAAHPTPEDILLLVEVADSSLAYDRDVKALIYARAGIPDYWLIDLNSYGLMVHRDPEPDGYRNVRTLKGDDRLSPQAFPELVFTAAEILG